jgi:hypothetical protein
MIRRCAPLRQVISTTPNRPYVRVEVGITIEDPFVSESEQKIDYMSVLAEATSLGVTIIDVNYEPKWTLKQDDEVAIVTLIQGTALPWLDEWTSLQKLTEYFSTPLVSKWTGKVLDPPIRHYYRALIYWHAGDLDKSEQQCKEFLTKRHGEGVEEPKRTEMQLASIRDRRQQCNRA